MDVLIAGGLVIDSKRMDMMPKYFGRWMMKTERQHLRMAQKKSANRIKADTGIWGSYLTALFYGAARER